MKGLIKGFGGRRIAVLGDAMLDEYVYGRVSRISPEAPVPVVEVRHREERLGGAANVARNITALGGGAVLISAVGEDQAAATFRSMAEEDGIDISSLVVAKDRPTTTKTRILAGNQQVVRIDAESSESVSGPIEGAAVRLAASAAGGADALVISDYDKGIITDAVLSSAVDAFSRSGKPIIVDPNVTHFFSYGMATVVTPNHLEVERVSGRRIRTEGELIDVSLDLAARLGGTSLLVTRGEEGMTLIEGTSTRHIKTVAREVYDVTGAGDTVVAVMALALAAGADLLKAATLANAAAGIVVAKRGTAVASAAELERFLGS